MPALNQLMVDSIAVTAIGVGGRATQLFGQVDYDRKVWVHSGAVGIFLSHQPFTVTARGFNLPVGQVVQFDIPARCELYAISAAGTIQVSRYSSTVMPTIGDLIDKVLQLLGLRVPQSKLR